MKRLAATIIFCLACAITAQAQRGGLDWMTDNADPQRSSWIRQDGKINQDSMQKPGFEFLWKMKVKNPPRQLNNLQSPATLDRLIGYRGFRMLGFFAGSGDNLTTIDTDLGRLEWEKHLNAAPSTAPSTMACPGGLTTGVARPALTAIPAAPSGPGGFGRNSPAKSAVGEPGQGAVTLANVRPNPPRPAGAAPQGNPMLVQSGRVNTANPPGGQLGAGPFWFMRWPAMECYTRCTYRTERITNRRFASCPQAQTPVGLPYWIARRMPSRPTAATKWPMAFG